MNKKNVKKTYWGIVLIAIAVLTVLKCIGVNLGLLGTLPTVDVVLGLVVLSIAVMSAVSLHFWALPVELAVIFMLFEDELAAYVGRTDPNIVSNWLLLGCALLMSVGISLLSGSMNWTKWGKVHVSNKNNAHISHGTNDSKRVKFGSETKYIDCTNFKTFYYMVSMADGSVYFSNTADYQGDGVLTVECKMGNMEIHVPAEWNIKVDIEANLGNVEYDGCGDPNGPLLTIDGICKMGNIEIHYC